MILSGSIICYSLCSSQLPVDGELAVPCEAEAAWFIILVAPSIEFLFHFHPLLLLLFFCITMQLCYFRDPFHLIYVYVCTQQKAINQTSICTLHNVSRCLGWGNVGDLMNNTSCSVVDASADNNKAGFYQRGPTRRAREPGTLAVDGWW